MPTFLADPPQVVIVLLVAGLLVTGLIWLNRRGRKVAIAFLVLLALTCLVVLVDRLFESPREEAVRRVQAMVAAADHHDPDAFVAHVADTVEYKGESQTPAKFTRDQLRRHPFWNLLRQFNAHVAAWDFSRDDVTYPARQSVEVGFLAKGEADGKPFPMYFRATFQRQADGQLKLVRLASFDAVTRNKPVSVPGL
jgi:hypothetical protein